jgi:hypothetical protein
MTLTIVCDISDEVLRCPSVCPTEPPMTNDACNIDSRYRCGYGDALVCEDSTYSFEHEKECRCYNGAFVCVSNECPEACPEIVPVEGAACTPFTNVTCYYPEDCCSKISFCFGGKRCHCEDGAVHCVDKFFHEAICPSDCHYPIDPVEFCKQSGGFGSCTSGEPFVCEDTRYAFQYEKSCQCFGVFWCSVNSCPIACPEGSTQ